MTDPMHMLPARRQALRVAGERMAGWGKTVLVGTGAYAFFSSTVSRADAFFLAAGTYAGMYLWLKLSQDYNRASQDPRLDRQTLHNDIARPLGGFNGKLALAAAFAVAQLGASAASQREHAAADAARVKSEQDTAPVLALSAAVGDTGKIAAEMCRGEEIKFIMVKQKLHKIPCAGLNVPPENVAPATP